MIEWNVLTEIYPILLLTLKLAFLTTGFLVLINIPIAYFLAFSRLSRRFKIILEILFVLPLVIPPTVLGFYLLLLFSKEGWLGKWIDFFTNQTLLFRFEGILIASLIFSFPFMFQPIYKAMKNFPKTYLEASYVLGKSQWITLLKIILPNIKNSIFAGMVLCFAHTLGEFGVILMVGGEIEGETKVMSVAIYNEVQALNYTLAHIYSLILLFSAIILLYIWNRIGEP